MDPKLGRRIGIRRVGVIQYLTHLVTVVSTGIVSQQHTLHVLLGNEKGGDDDE